MNYLLKILENVKNGATAPELAEKQVLDLLGVMNTKLLVSFSAGETSAYMAKMLKEKFSDKYDMFFVFANTGKEREETLIFADKCDKEFGLNLVWVEAETNMKKGKGVKAKVVNFETASRNGEPFYDMIKKHGIPNTQMGFCTRELKDYAIRAYCRQIGLKKSDYKIAIGIRADEFDRVNPNFKSKGFAYPLIDSNITKPQINAFWAKMPFRLNLKSYEGNCDFCFKKSDRKLLTIAKENPQVVKWWSDIEKEFENYNPRNAVPPFTFFRNNRNAKYFIENSNSNFRLATDEKFNTAFSKSLFDELDFSGTCDESCLAFNYS